MVWHVRRALHLATWTARRPAGRRHRGGSRGGAQGFGVGRGGRDASGLKFLDSASLRVLILAARALKGRHGRLVFARPQPLVARLLEITGADRLLEVQE